MLKRIAVIVAVVFLGTWMIGCDDDDPVSPGPTTGTVTVNPSPDTLSCSWQLDGPSSYSYNGIGGETLNSLTPGDYTLTWGVEAGWNPPSPASSTQTLEAGKTVNFSGTYTVTVVETVSIPDVPIGPNSGVENQDLSYSAAGASSSQGHAVEYRFDWGDGSLSDWGATAVQNSWATAGIYEVKTQARCIAHPSVESSWSGAKTVTITVFVAETVSAPNAPNGSESNQAGQVVSYTATGAASSYGDSLQYRFDWGDGQTSNWSNTNVQSHSWASEGTYEVKAQARCRDHTSVMSDWSAAKSVTITAAPAETVSAPDAPGGPDVGETNESLTYTAGGAISTDGHTVEYRFDFGDGTVTGWLYGLTNASHSWTSAGSYDVKAQARCRTHTAVESDWSAATVVTISVPAESMANLPSTINGVDAGIINDPYEYTVIHSTTTNLGDAVEGRFDWGDGTNSGWINPGPYAATHSWSTEGTYVVTYQARCTVHNDFTASAESLVVTITTTAVETMDKPPFTNYSVSLRNPEINVEKTYYIYGGTSSLGHDVETMVDWGDGTQSGWVAHGAPVNKTWTVAGTYEMTRQSRCIAHPDVVSEWSDPINIYPKDPEFMTAPIAPPGPTVGHRYDRLVYTATGAYSSWHPGTWIEYRFDWGDGSAITAWSSADTVLSHQFTNFGDYEVKTQARCSYPGHGVVESVWSPATVVSIVEKVTIYQYSPQGPYYGAAGQSNTWEIYSKASSDAGHATFEYQFDWGDGTISPWSSSESASHAFASAGTYQLYYRARCAVDTLAVSDWSAQYLQVEITDGPEAVQTPDVPSEIPYPVVVGVSKSISTSHSYCNHGHPVEFYFDFGDGTNSGWIIGSPWSSFYQVSTNHTFTAPGTYDITCRARCAIDPAVESAWSAARSVTVYENITQPGVPTGPTTGATGANLTFTTTGSNSSEGHTLEYSFEYRQGTWTVVHTSDWSASLSDDYVFIQAGNYRVRVRARCVTDTGALSSWSGYFDLTISD